MNYWILKVGDQKKYADVLGERYVFDNTHSIKLATGDHFIYLSTKKNKYEFIGFGKVASLESREPIGTEKRTNRVRLVYTAYLTDVHWFAEPLDFSSQKGRLNRMAVGIENTLAWGISMPRISEELYAGLIQLAQPENGKVGIHLEVKHSKGVPTKEWLDPTDTTGKYLEGDVKKVESNPDFEPDDFNDARDRTLRSLFVRRGQPKFRKELIQAYEGKCAITGFDAVNALQAAHIYPYRGSDTNQLNNGLLLRSDIHDLFDLGLITFDTSSMTVILHESLMSTAYANLHQLPLRLPAKKEHLPSKVYLDWHRAWWSI